MTEAEIAAWVVDLRRYHDEETRRHQTRLEVQREQDEHYDLLVDNFNGACEVLEAEHRRVAEAYAALTRERTAFAEERYALTRERQELATERAALAEMVDRVGSSFLEKLLLAFMGGVFTLVLLIFMQRVVPLLVRWVGGWFG